MFKADCQKIQEERRKKKERQEMIRIEKIKWDMLNRMKYDDVVKHSLAELKEKRLREIKECRDYLLKQIVSSSRKFFFTFNIKLSLILDMHISYECQLYSLCFSFMFYLRSNQAISSKRYHWKNALISFVNSEIIWTFFFLFEIISIIIIDSLK